MNVPLAVRTSSVASSLKLGRWILGLLCSGWLLAAPAHGQNNEDKLVGQVRDPSICPSDPDIIAYERDIQDARELFIYNQRTGTVDQVQSRREDAGTGGIGLLDLFDTQDLSNFSRYEGQLSWRARLDAKERQWFAFVGTAASGFDIYLSYVDARGRASAEPPIQLSFEGLDLYPQWSPDGQSLLFVSGSENGSDLYVIHNMSEVIANQGRGLSPQRLTASPALEAHPAWSPDGQYIAFQTRVIQDGRANWGISTVRLADQQGNAVPQSVALTGDLSAYDEFKPSWAPDGQHLAFYVSRARIDEGGDNLEQDIGIVGVVRDNNGRVVRGRVLTGFSLRLAVNVIPNTNRGPSWMPAQDALLLVHVKRDLRGFPIFATDFARWQGRQPGYEQELSSGFGTINHRDPVLAPLPNGVRVAFVSQEGGANKLQVKDRANDTGSARQLTIPVEKSAGIAFKRSLLIPGRGQLYKGQKAKGALFLVGTAAALGAAALFASQADAGTLNDLEATYKRSVSSDLACRNAPSSPCLNTAFQAWQDEYDSAKSSQTLAFAAAGAAVGLWLLNLIDSRTGFPRTVRKPIRIAGANLRLRSAEPHMTYRGGTPHYGMRVQVNF